MTEFDIAITDLEKTYNVLGVIELSTHDSSKDTGWLYKTLQSFYRPTFENNDRIVVVQDNSDVYDYVDLPSRSIAALQKCASQIDISNFFILVVTANKDIAKELEQARKLYSTDNVSIQSLVVSGTYRPVSESQDTFCVYPWMHLYVGPDGNILPCCVSDQNYPMGNILDTSVDDILKGEKFNQLRHNMLTGKKSKECSHCYLRENNQQSSMRQYANVKWRDKANKINKTQTDGVPDTFTPTYLDIRLNNICNLKCRMCSGYFSSSIAQEEILLFGSSNYSDLTIRNKERQQALADIVKFIPMAEKIYFAGGEPLLAVEHYQILDSLLECGNTSVELTYNTNFTTTVFRGNSVFDLWNQFEHVTIGASIDAAGKAAEYIRHGTVWQDIEKNLKDLKEKCPHVNLNIASTVGFLNVSSLIELQQFWIATDTVDSCKFEMNALVTPEHLSLQSLPEHHKTRLKNLISNHINWCNNTNAKLLAERWAYLIDYMMLRDTSFQLPEFIRLFGLLDQYRGENFVQIFPEYQDLFKHQ